MDGQALDLTKKKGKKKSNPAFKGQEKSLGSLRRKLDQDTWGFLGAWDPRDVQWGQVKTKTVQGGMTRNTKEDKYVPINHPMMQKRDQKI